MDKVHIEGAMFVGTRWWHSSSTPPLSYLSHSHETKVLLKQFQWILIIMYNIVCAASSDHYMSLVGRGGHWTTCTFNNHHLFLALPVCLSPSPSLPPSLSLISVSFIHPFIFISYNYLMQGLLLPLANSPQSGYWLSNKVDPYCSLLLLVWRGRRLMAGSEGR